MSISFVCLCPSVWLCAFIFSRVGSRLDLGTIIVDLTQFLLQSLREDLYFSNLGLKWDINYFRLQLKPVCVCVFGEFTAFVGSKRPFINFA